MAYLKGGTYVDGDLYVDGQIKVRGATSIESGATLTLAHGDQSVGAHQLLRFNETNTGAVEKSGIVVANDANDLQVSLADATAKVMILTESKNIKVNTSSIVLNTTAKCWEFA